MDKRSFLKGLALIGIGSSFKSDSLESFISSMENRTALDLATDEDFWSVIRSHYQLKPEYINLENGYYNILPKPILEKFIDHVREVNYQGAYYMRTVQFDNKKNMVAKLAQIAGCSADELILTRNTTESLDMIIGGFPWQKGDEAIMAEQDYGSMLEMFKQSAKRFGIVNKVLSIPNHPQSDDEIIQLYANAISPKTKLLMIPQMVNITGQILPVQKICDMAHSKGVEVMVDGAHAFAHIQFNIPDLHCDYYGASLHKWLSVPLGAGILFVRKEKVKKIWPLLAENDSLETIGRLNHIGTHPVHTDLAISDAIDYYLKLGVEKKEARLRYLQQYWTTKVRGIGKIKVNTPVQPERSCAIANVGIEGMKPGLLAETLLKKYQIYTVAIDGANVHGCRITPNVFTLTKELDMLIDALKEMS
jgi:selenocysteine lyase/cysteine desulfurase